MSATRAGGVPAASRTFAPEAHLPRNRRLLIDSWGVAVELGIGIQHRLAWRHCAAVVRFPDRIELVLTPDTSLVVRAGDWYQGDQAVELAYSLAPPDLRLELPGTPEPGMAPYVLTGLAKNSVPLLSTLLIACLGIALMALALAGTNHRWQAALIGMAFLLPVWPLVRALGVRLAVPGRWRRMAANTSRAQVVLDGQLTRAPVSLVRVTIVAALVLAVVLSVLWWQAVGGMPWLLLAVGVAVAGRAHHELRRRRGR